MIAASCRTRCPPASWRRQDLYFVQPSQSALQLRRDLGVTHSRRPRSEVGGSRGLFAVLQPAHLRRLPAEALCQVPAREPGFEAQLAESNAEGEPGGLKICGHIVERTWHAGPAVRAA